MSRMSHDIFDRVCELARGSVESPWPLTMREVLSSSKRGPALRARILVVGACRDGLGLFYADIAWCFGRRGHSSLLHLYELWLEEPAQVRERFLELVAADVLARREAA